MSKLGGDPAAAADTVQTTISVSSGQAAPAQDRIDLEPVKFATGESIPTSAGLVSLSGDTLKQVRIETDGLEAVHFFGDALGSLTANYADGRVIETTTNISIDLANVSPEALGSTIPRLDGLALESASMLSRQGGL